MHSVKKYEETGPYLLYDPMDPELLRQPDYARKFKVYRSLRDVEPNTPVVQATRRHGRPQEA